MILGKDGRSVTAYTLSESNPVDLQRENDILKQRCSYYASRSLCEHCDFNCFYRLNTYPKKWSKSND